MNPLDELKRRYPWPARMPGVPPDEHGWFQACNARVLSRFLDARTRLVVELGSWLGKSSRFIVERAPRATLVAIDHWLGSPEHRRPDRADVYGRLPRLYQTFLRNCWPWRDRIVPMRTTTVAGMRELAALKLAPELIYIDAGHAWDDVLADVQTAVALFPTAQLVGDDYVAFPAVREAVRQMANVDSMRVEADGNAWILHKRADVAPTSGDQQPRPFGRRPYSP